VLRSRLMSAASLSRLLMVTLPELAPGRSHNGSRSLW
jgi:hypothetical protein